MADGQEFNYVDSALTAFIFGDEGLRLTKSIRKVALRQARGFARSDHKLTEDALTFGMD